LLKADEFVELIFGDGNEECKKTFTGLATVEQYEDVYVYLLIDGERQVSNKGRRHLDSYNPSRGDRVLVFRDIVVGKIR